MRPIMIMSVIGRMIAASTTVAAGRRREVLMRGIVGLFVGGRGIRASITKSRLDRGDPHYAGAHQGLLLRYEGKVRDGVERPRDVRLDISGRRRRGRRERPGWAAGIVKDHGWGGGQVREVGLGNLSRRRISVDFGIVAGEVCPVACGGPQGLGEIVDSPVVHRDREQKEKDRRQDGEFGGRSPLSGTSYRSSWSWHGGPPCAGNNRSH